MTVGERIAMLRKNCGYTRTTFAQRIGIPHTTLRNYETGVREPGHSFLIQMANEFSVSTDYLLCLTDDPTPMGTRKSPTSDETETEDECLDEIVEIYHELNTEGQEHLLKTARYCSNDPEYKKRAEGKNAG